VAIYDGAEGGDHYTWSLFKVTAASSFWKTAGPWLALTAFALVAMIAWLARAVVRSKAAREGAT
jgi:hypothetical protein